MHEQRNAGPTPPAAGTELHVAQRVVLLELLLAPPPGLDDVPSLPRRVELAEPDVRAALAALVRAGLAGADGDLAWASPPARYFEALYPACP
jgi:hypothetical protein